MSVIWDISSLPTPRKGAFGTAHGALVSIALLSFAVVLSKCLACRIFVSRSSVRTKRLYLLMFELIPHQV